MDDGLHRPIAGAGGRLNSAAARRPVLAPALVVVLLLAGLGVLVFQGIAILLAFGMPDLEPAPPAPGIPGRRVRVVVAARNEALDLPSCLDGLAAQDYSGLEVVVVDGGSTDGTREVALARTPAVRLIEEPPLPEGWVGKNWACSLGAADATTDYLLFLDADVRLHPSAVRRAVEWAESEHADLVSLAPRLEAVSFWERVVLPFMVPVILPDFRPPRVNRSDSRTAMANGQFLLVRREAYVAVGGHELVRSAVLEDVRLAQEFRRADRPMRIAWSPALLTTRMYRDRHEMFEGLLKNIHGTRFSLARQLAFLAALVGFFYLPFGLLPLGLYYGSVPIIGLGAFLYVALFAKHVGFARSVSGHAAYGLLFPVAVGFYVVLVCASIRSGLARRPIEWKGRSYPREA